ncbi:NAD(P)/FAD-dependent oxidoreductase [Acuticoccus sp.]|uniref:NAD(P)/FAD-dependent oxidoreductase n=1 Tax=Acuticoccus sp. TaxID=1904378 RepID=UPI003B52B948
MATTPLWWDDAPPGPGPDDMPPPRADVLIVGGGYAGLSCALALAEGGADVVVVDAEMPGHGGSSRNGGQVTGGWGLIDLDAKDQGLMRERVASGLRSLTDFEATVARLGLQGCWQPTGKFVGAFAPSHLPGLARKAEWAAKAGVLDTEVVTRAEQHREVATELYHGGVRFSPGGAVQPARLLAGLLAAALRAGARVVAPVRVTGLERRAGGWRVATERGAVEVARVVVATNGYTGSATPALQRRVVPVASHIIATAPLAPEDARALIPHARPISDTARVLSYFRLSPDGRRLVFGGRASFGRVGPSAAARGLVAMMLRRFPQLAGTRITHSWQGNVAFARDRLPHMGEADGLSWAVCCNGSGVAMMTYLGERVAHRILTRPNGPVCAFDDGVVPSVEHATLPTIPLYTGRPWFVPLIGMSYRLRDRLDRLSIR